ncbi:unnamed protein product [Callosobruchus maculatus]|uniref:DUF4806 domain-containing protein n=1 Tax=Callosobruchus maculatus TaxID=64391 RepID=A0A653C371_CALMS|nr:unnamed protein product [Callosobruchus maculatus]
MNLDEKEWIVVHFIDEDMVEAVPRVWYMFEYNMCSWPPMNFRRFLPDLIKKKEIPEDFQAKILGQYDDFQMAKRKALKARDTMDLSSNNDIPSRKMRHFKHIQKNKFLSSDSENDKDDDDDDDENIYPSMPIKNLATQLNTNKNLDTPVRMHHNSPRGQLYTKHTSPQVLPQKCNSQPEFGVFPTSCNKEKLQPNFNFPPKTDGYGSSLEMKEFQRQVLHQLNVLSTKILENSEVLQLLLAQKEVQQVNYDSSLDEMLQLFPLRTEESLSQLEAFLDSNDNMVALAKELSRKGGGSANALAKKILYCCFSNELGLKFSWEGAKGKRPFKNLISQAVLKAVPLNKVMKMRQ